MFQVHFISSQGMMGRSKGRIAPRAALHSLEKDLKKNVGGNDSYAAHQ